MLEQRCSVLMSLIALGCLGVCGQASGMHPPVESEYQSVVGAGGLRFEGVTDLELMFLVEVGDFNFDNVEDLLFAFTSEGNYDAAYALGSINDDGTTSFTISEVVSSSQYESISASDIDGDGRPEMFMRKPGTNEVQIIRILGDGDWISQLISIPFTDYSIVNGGFDDARSGVESGDLDGDGLGEVVYNTSNASIVIRWSSRPEDAEFQVYPVPAAGSRNALYDLRDYDGDGLLDVLLLNADTERFVLLRGTGTDSVVVPVEIEVPVLGFVDRGDLPYFGNFDGNGVVDLVLNNSGDGTSVVVPDFVSVSGTSVVLAIGDDESVAGVPGDLDGSGADELLVVGVDDESHPTRVIEEVSLVFDALSVGADQRVIEVGNVPITEVLLEDSSVDALRVPLCQGISFGGTGDQDLLWMGKTRGYTITTQVGLNTPEIRQGAMLRVSSWRGDGEGLPTYGASQFEGQNVPLHILPTDIDSDGVDELIVVGQASRAKLVDVNDAVTTNMSGVNDAFMSAMADLGGDGRPEAVFAQVVNSLSVLPVNEDGTFEPRIAFPNPNGGNYRTLNVADFDADGRDDVFIYDTAANEHHLWRGTGDAQAELWTTFNPMSRGAIKIGIMDFNSDGLPDLVGASESAFELWMNDGDGTFTLASTFPTPYEPYWIVTADMDQDGVVDIVSVNIDNPTMIFFMGDDLQPELLAKLSHGGDFAEFEVVTGDLDGNGLPDIVASSAAQGVNPLTDVSSQHLVWMQSSPRFFLPGGVLPASESSSVAVSDLNGDGALDVATASDWDNSVRVHWGSVGAGAGCSADLNEDGVLDFFDISAFLSGEPDFNGDGGFDFFDISAFLTAYAAGCA